MSMVLFTFVICAILAILFHATIRRPLLASIATGVALVFIVRFLFGYHFPEINSLDFWLFSSFIATLGFVIAYFIGRVTRKGKTFN